MLLGMRKKARYPRHRQAKPGAASMRDRLLDAGTLLFRRQGFVATTVDEICAEAGTTKGAFFHHFQSKEALAEACLDRWKVQISSSIAEQPCMGIDDPVSKVTALLDFVIAMYADPKTLKSCLAGTTVQEVSETHPRLRKAANCCFESLKTGLASLLKEAGKSRGVQLDSDALATLWVVTMQGALVLYKASRDEAVITDSLRHVRGYIASQLELTQPAAGRTRKRRTLIRGDRS